MTANIPLFRFTTQALDPRYPVGERLDVFPAGRAGLWVTAAADPARRAQAGSWLARLDDGELSQVQALASRTLALPEDLDHAPSRGVYIEENLLVEVDGQRRGFSLNYSHDVTPPEALAEMLELRAALLAKLRAAPAAVVELNARLAEAEGRPELVLACTGVGTGPVVFTFDPGSLAVRGRSAGGWRSAWQHPDERGMGLVGKMGVLVDGLYAPAELVPGERGTLVKALDEPPAGVGDERMWARMEGRIRLVGPGYGESDFPDQPFVVECELG